jgi:hypothetical protein
LFQPVEKKGKYVSSIAPIVLLAQKSALRICAKELNENSMLAARFCIAPMMDWSESSSVSIS